VEVLLCSDGIGFGVEERVVKLATEKKIKRETGWKRGQN